MHKSIIPEPSKLYSLKPEGLGTPDTESLASYAMRLAEAHCLDVGSLIHRFVSPFIEGVQSASQTRKRINKIHLHNHSLTSDHLHISKWVDITDETQATVSALSDLTKREKLHLLTLLPLKGYVLQDTVLRHQRTWCPCCYEDQKNAGKPVYDMLIWSFRDVCICPRHEQRLWSRCFWCSARQPILESWSQPGYCAKCKSWLGRDYRRPISTVPQDWWNANAIGNIISAWNDLPPGKTRNPPTIQRLLSRGYKTKGKIENLYVGLG
jgi:TniQ